MKYNVTYHAIKRYRQRVRPGMGAGVCREICERLQEAPVVERPAWASMCAERGATYKLLDDDTVAVLKGRVVVTVLTRRSADEMVRRQCERLGWCRESAAA